MTEELTEHSVFAYGANYVNGVGCPLEQASLYGGIEVGDVAAVYDEIMWNEIDDPKGNHKGLVSRETVEKIWPKVIDTCVAERYKDLAREAADRLGLPTELEEDG